MTVPADLLEILVCPQCKHPVEPDAQQENLICRTCRLAYPVRDDIPVMLIDEAQDIGE